MSRYATRIVIVFVSALLLHASPSAFAQSAKRLLAVGNRLFAAGDYRAAYEAFSTGNAKRKSAVFLRNMAYCKLKLYQHREALELLQRYLKKYKGARDASKLRQTVQTLAEVIQTKISIDSSPPGAEIYIDAEAAGKVGTTPHKISIEPGTHTVILRKTGFEPTTRTFTIAARESKSIALPLHVGLEVGSVPANATIFVDGAATALGTTPYKGSLSAGKHRIVLRLAGFKEIAQEVTASGPVLLNARFKIAQEVLTNPAGAHVTITALGGAKTEGTTPLLLDLAPGAHTITIELNGFAKVNRSFDVKPGAGPLRITLEGGLLTMRASHAPGAALTVNTLKIGALPLKNAPVPLGSHVLRVRHPERGLWERRIEFKADEIVTVDSSFGESRWPLWTALGLTGASGAAWAVLGGMALGKNSEYAQDPNDSSKCYDKSGGSVSCFSLHDAATVPFVLTLVGSAVSGYLIYHYLIQDRDKVRHDRRGDAEAAPKAATLMRRVPGRL